MYDQRIRIEAKQSTIDPEYGTKSISWVPFATVWAQVQDILPSASAEKQPGGIRVENKPARIRIRYMSGITSDMRIILLNRGSEVMQIIAGPAELGRKAGIEFLAEQYSTDGQA